MTVMIFVNVKTNELRVVEAPVDSMMVPPAISADWKHLGTADVKPFSAYPSPANLGAH
jgi:hypothetical protein